jgi:hypothetical protein
MTSDPLKEPNFTHEVVNLNATDATVSFPITSVTFTLEGFGVNTLYMQFFPFLIEEFLRLTHVERVPSCA